MVNFFSNRGLKKEPVSFMLQIQTPDPVARKKALILLGVGMIFGCVFLSTYEWYLAHLEEWILAQPERRQEKLLWILAALLVLFLPVLFAAVYFWRTACSVMDAQRFPLPGAKVIRQTPILTGAKALFRGRVLQVCAVFLGGGAVVVPVVFWWVLGRLLGQF